MTTKKQILDNELMKEIIAIRFNTLHQMLHQHEQGSMPGVYEEGATGSFDNKGAIFIPGGLIYQDVDERFIRYDSYGTISAQLFRKKIRTAMRNDNATLLYPDGIAPAINLDGGFFSRAARRIFTYKKAAYRRSKKIGSTMSLEVSSDDIIKSHCPTYMKPPYGARTRISTCISVGLIEPPMYYAYNKTELNFSVKQGQRFIEDLDRARENTLSAEGSILYPPYIIICHDTRYKKNSFTGLTRILGLGEFGEFATLSFEALNKRLQSEFKRNKLQAHKADAFAQLNDTPIFGILRIYRKTNPGKRLLKYQLHIISPVEDADIDLDA
ncbi:MAG: hypothetical protein ACR2PB_12545 [Desulfocapsaceae bacterium]